MSTEQRTEPLTDEQLAAWESLLDSPVVRKLLERHRAIDTLRGTVQATFIDAAVTAFPVLLDEVRRLKVAVAAERERCARVVEACDLTDYTGEIAAAIRQEPVQ